MSKILRRPMFRGGPVDSRGTGITSGLMDGGRVGLKVSFPGTVGQAQEFLTGGDIMDLSKTKFSAGMPFPYKVGPIKDEENEEIEEVGKVKETFEPLGSDILDSDFDTTETIDGKIVTKPYKGYVGNEPGIDRTTKEFFKGLGEPGMSEGYKQAVEDAKKISETPSIVGGREDPDVENARIQQENYEKNQKSQLEQILSGNVEESTEAGIDDIKAQAELFKEILNADNKKKLKDARISDASDYLLKFFEGSQREGATVGSAAADVAAFATSKDSKTERAKAAIEKTDQTASALAINDYISGKKSKAEIAKMMKLAEYRSDLAAERGKKNVGEYIMSSKELGFSNKVKEGVQAKYGPRVFEEVTSEIMSDSTKFKPDESDVGKVYIETDTKTVYTFDKDGNRIPIYQG